MVQMPAKVKKVRRAGPDHQVVTVIGGKFTCRPEPCGGCPWKVKNAGNFPAEAFKHSASTSYDMALSMFSCHESGSGKPATCAGFVMNGAANNLAVRMKYANGELAPEDVTDGGEELFESYREMAVANGVDPNDPTLVKCV